MCKLKGFLYITEYVKHGHSGLFIFWIISIPWNHMYSTKYFNINILIHQIISKWYSNFDINLLYSIKEYDT